MLKAVSLSHHYHTETLFAGVDLILNPGDRVALVGPNGAGKSTLLRILVGELAPSGGQVLRAPGTTVGYFAQQVADPATHVGEFLRAGLGEVAEVQDRLDALADRLAAGDTDVLAEYGDTQSRWHDLNGWAAATALSEVRQRLDIAHLPDEAALGEISGGEQARLTLARVLLGRPDLLVLDEPTNHLDAEGIEWLSNHLAHYRGGVLVVSHDRALLDQAVNRIIELDGIHEEPQCYEGGYTAYREEKARRWQRYLLDYEAQEKQRARWEADIAKTKGHALGVENSVRSGPGADTKRRYAKKVAKKAKVRERLLQRQLAAARWLAEPQTRPVLQLAFPAEGGSDETVVRACGVGRDNVWKPCDLAVRGGERIRLTGRNGAGKTTLLRLLAGQLAPDEGQLTTVGQVHLLPQTHDALRTATTVIDFFRSGVPVYVDDAEELLDAYLFGPESWDTPMRTLSAGELRRLLLAVIVNSGATTLLLDEPTNYLDFDSLDVVEEAVRAFHGTLVIVTHDAYFAERVGCTRHWDIVDGVIVDEPIHASV